MAGAWGKSSAPLRAEACFSEPGVPSHLHREPETRFAKSSPTAFTSFMDGLSSERSPDRSTLWSRKLGPSTPLTTLIPRRGLPTCSHDCPTIVQAVALAVELES